MSETAITPQTEAGPPLYGWAIVIVQTVYAVMAGPNGWAPAADGSGKSWLDVGLLSGKIITKTDINPDYLGNPLAPNRRLLGYESHKGAYLPQVEGEYEL